jgi:hypothetical protein
MSRIHHALLCLGALALLGCPGTIDDPESFEAFEPGQGAGDPTLDAGGTTRRDAGNLVADAGSPGGGSGGGLDAGKPAGGGSTAPSCDFKALMQSKCGSSGCHGAPALSTGLDLTSEGLASRLKDKQASGACSDYLLIDPATPERSALYLMVTDDSCGIRMPLGGTLSAAEQTCVLQWIENL